jgi:hypothetical protein
MGYSYGYNREEDAWDYNSTQSLVLQLIDKVSRGGNFLLDIGPDEHGKIPPIMQERLLQIGEWLKINGEAIYGTSRWKESSQWSEGRRDYKDRSGDMLLKITVDPEPGYAVKEVFYTYNATTNSLYAILPKYPDNKKIILQGVVLPAATNISFLSTKEKLSWKAEGNNTVIELPEYNPNKIKAPYAYAIKISGYGMFSKKPMIKAEHNNGMQPLITLSSTNNDVIRYTIDGTEPSPTSELYIKPFTINKTSVIKAKTFVPGSLPSGSIEQKVIKYEWMNAVKTNSLKPGIAYKYYQPESNINLVSSFGAVTVNEGVTDIISIAKKQRKDKFAFEFSGYIKINKDSFYTFYTASDDGSKLFIDDMEVVNNDGNHGMEEKNGKAALKKGWHRIKVIYYDAGGDNDLKAFIQPEGGNKEEISSSLLYH